MTSSDPADEGEGGDDVGEAGDRAGIVSEDDRSAGDGSDGVSFEVGAGE
jgi:hypothetical protein